jgi:hypothetical protein
VSRGVCTPSDQDTQFRIQVNNDGEGISVLQYTVAVLAGTPLHIEIDPLLARMSTVSARRQYLKFRSLQQHQRHYQLTPSRLFSSNVRIPEPTWSIKELDLTSKKPPIPPEELERLSRLALIDIESMPDKEGLRQDLANMLHMMDQVSSFYAAENESFESQNHDDQANAERAAEIYDVVRGVTKAPLRKSVDEDPLQTKDQAIAGDVWNSLLQPKTTRKGGRHDYFVIQTKKHEE